MNDVTEYVSDGRELVFKPDIRITRGALESRVSTTPASVDVNICWKNPDSSILIYNSDATKQKIVNILSTLVGEEHFEPEWGSLLPLRLWEPSQQSLTLLLKRDIIDALRIHLEGIIYVYHGLCRIFPYPDQESYTVLLVYDELTSVNNPQYLLHPFRT